MKNNDSISSLISKSLLFVLVSIFFCSTTYSQTQLQPLLVRSNIWISDSHIFNEDSSIFLNFSKVFKTYDGGLTWDSISLPGNARKFDFYFRLGIALHEAGYLYRTEDYGESWDTLPSLNSVISDVVILDTNRIGLCTGDGYILTSQDKGISWDTTAQPAFSSTPWAYLTSFDFLDNGVGFVGSGAGLVAFTSDSGQTWNGRTVNGVAGAFSDIAFADSLTGFAVDDGPAIGDHVWYTNDGGYTWLPDINTFGLTKYRSVDFNETGVGIVLSTNKLMHSTNFGLIWDTLYYSLNTSDPVLTTVKISDQNVAYIGGADGIYKIDSGVLSTNELNSNMTAVNVSPNPVSNEFTVDVGDRNQFCELQLYSTAGQLVFNNEYHTSQFTVPRNGLPGGLYFYRIVSEVGKIYSGKVVFE